MVTPKIISLSAKNKRRNGLVGFGFLESGVLSIGGDVLLR